MSRKDVYTGFYLGAGLSPAESEQVAEKMLEIEHTFFSNVDITPPWIRDRENEERAEYWANETKDGDPF